MADEPIGSKLSDVIPASTPSFETFPTAAELATARMTLAHYEYVDERVAVCPLDPQAWREYANSHSMRACLVLIEALANAHEIDKGLPLRWPPQEIRRRIPIPEIMTYFSAMLEAMGVDKAALTAAMGAGTETEAGGNGRPTLPKTKAAGRKRKPPTGRSSRTASTTSTAGAQAPSAV